MLKKESLDDSIRQIQDLIDAERLDEAMEINIRYYEQALAEDTYELIAYSLYYFGLIEEKKANAAKAMTFYKKGTAIARRHMLTQSLVKILIRRGNIYMSMGRIHSAIDKYTEALGILDDYPVDNQKEVVLNNLALIYLDVSDYDQAMKYLYEAMSIAKENNNLLLLGTVYANLCESYIYKKSYLKAKYYNQLTEGIVNRINDVVGKGYVLSNQAIIHYHETNDFVKAQELFIKARSYLLEESREIDRFEISLAYAKVAYEAHEYDLVLEILEPEVETAKLRTLYNNEAKALKLMVAIYKEKKDYEIAYRLLTRYVEISENSYNQMKNMSLQKIERNLSDQDEVDEVDKLQRSIKTLKTLSEIGQKITVCHELNEIIEVLLNDTGDLFDFDTIGLGLIDEATNTIDYRYITQDEYKEFRIDRNEEKYVMVLCIKGGHEIIVYDSEDRAYNRKHFDESLYQIIDQADMQSIVFSPIKFEQVAIGGVTIQSYKKNAFSYMDLESLRVLASYIAIAVTNMNRAKELLIANKKLEDASYRDGLTGLLNRHALGQYIGKGFIGSVGDKLPAIALMMDIDFFKQYNDNYGHIMGDRCLKWISSTLTVTLEAKVGEERYHLFRYGGDEFFAVVETITLEQCKVLLDSVVEAIRTLHITHAYSKVEDYVTMSIGVAFIKDSIQEYTTVFNQADEALYKAKELGRNQYHIQPLNIK